MAVGLLDGRERVTMVASFCDFHVWRTSGRIVIVHQPYTENVPVLSELVLRSVSGVPMDDALTALLGRLTEVPWDEPVPHRIYEHESTGEVVSWLTRTPWLLQRVRSADGQGQVTVMV